MKEKIKKVIKKTFNIEEVNDDISSSNCDQWDSLQQLYLVVELESEFNVSIEPEEIAEMKSLLDIERILNKILNL